MFHRNLVAKLTVGLIEAFCPFVTHLHAGHTGLLAVGGLLNGIFGSDEDRHLATWSSVKVVDKTTEEDEQGVITIREKERFSNELTLVYATGRVATLK